MHEYWCSREITAQDQETSPSAGYIANMHEYWDEELCQRLRTKFSARYAHENLKGLFTKTSVSELKKKSYVEEAEVSVHEAPFAQADSSVRSHGLTGAERGTAYHRIMELLDEEIFASKETLDPISKKLYAWGCRKAEEGWLSPEEQQAVWTPDITAFLATDLGQRMGEAFRRGELMREKPFMMGVPANELDSKFPKEEMVLVQGIIDAWFIEGDELVLLDYKTDRVSE
jgi:ATP-dependent helicase/nuclease subunit A